jgi:hypothetical protein
MHPTFGKWIMGVRSGLFVFGCVGLFWFGGVGAGAVFAGAGGAAAGRAADRWDWSEATGSGFAVDSGWADEKIGKEGMPAPMQAITAATGQNAKLLHLQDRGMIAAGVARRSARSGCEPAGGNSQILARLLLSITTGAVLRIYP